MDPLTLISGGASILGALFGGSAQKKTLKLQREQFEFQKKLAQEQLALAREAQRQGLATQVDAAGNVTAYDPATNTWKTILSADQQQLLDASERESLLQLTQDASLSRGQRLSSAREQVADRETSQALRGQINDQIAGRGNVNASDVASSLRLARERAVSQGFDDVSNALSLQAIRSGAGGLDRIGSGLAKARSQAIAQAMGNPELEGMQFAQDMNQSRMGNNANLYSLFAARANGVNPAPNVSATPSTASLQAARQAGQQGIGQAGSLIGSSGNLTATNQVPFDNTWGDLFSGIGILAGSPAGNDLANLAGRLMNRGNPIATAKANASSGLNRAY